MNQFSNPFEHIVAQYTDDKIITIVNSKHEYLSKLMEVCKMEAERRGLNIISTQKVPNEKLIKFLFETRRLISEGESIESCKKYLFNNGLSEDQMNSILNKAQKPEPKYEINTRQIEDVNLLGIGTIITLISLAVRFFFYLSE